MRGIVKAHGGLTGRTGMPCSFCDGPDHTFEDCSHARAFGRGEAVWTSELGWHDASPEKAARIRESVVRSLTHR